MAVIKLTPENFDEMTKKSEKCLVDFYAEWCGPCSMLSPLVEELSEDMDDIDFFKVDTDECTPIAIKYGIDRIPFLAVMKNGEIVATKTGYLPMERLREFVEEA